MLSLAGRAIQTLDSIMRIKLSEDRQWFQLFQEISSSLPPMAERKAERHSLNIQFLRQVHVVRKAPKSTFAQSNDLEGFVECAPYLHLQCTYKNIE